MNEKSRRLRIVSVSPELIADMVHEGWHIPNGNQRQIRCVNGVPHDAVFVEMRLAARMNAVALLFEHPSFDEVADGGQIPEVTVTLEAQYEST